MSSKQISCRGFSGGVLAFSLMAGLGSASAAELTWNELKPSVFGQRLIRTDGQVVKLEAPYRASDDRQVPIAVQADLPNGGKIKSVAIVIDENPMPVSLTVMPHQQRSSLWVSANMRFNGPSPVRAIVEAENGQLFMSEAMVKTTGQGACSAPPVTKLDGAESSIGKMELAPVVMPISVSAITNPIHRTRLNISHPNLTGLQLDQITLRYILPRYVEKIEVEQGEEKLMSMEAGISLAENPSIAFDYAANGTGTMRIVAEDTDETVFDHKLSIEPGS